MLNSFLFKNKRRESQDKDQGHGSSFLTVFNVLTFVIICSHKVSNQILDGPQLKTLLCLKVSIMSLQRSCTVYSDRSVETISVSKNFVSCFSCLIGISFFNYFTHLILNGFSRKFSYFSVWVLPFYIIIIYMVCFPSIDPLYISQGCFVILSGVPPFNRFMYLVVNCILLYKFFTNWNNPYSFYV